MGLKSDFCAYMQPEKILDNHIDRFPIVGIGGSAGGLDAFEQFLSNVPDQCGMAFVIVQHLDPTQKGMLPELLQRITLMHVYQAKDHMVVLPDCVYVIPPNKIMTISKGILYLHIPNEEDGLRLPIDTFFRSLADDKKEKSVGIILSGMGSDGSLGIQAIKERNGIVMVQNPDTARFNSMPNNAIEAVTVDVIAPVYELPAKLSMHFKELSQDKSAFEVILSVLRIHTGNDFSLYKRNAVYRRIERRMAVYKIESFRKYAHFLEENPSEATILFKELLIGVTRFFRDSDVWERLIEIDLPALIAKQKKGSKLRAWIPGCSTGEEAYSLAIAFTEALEKTRPNEGITLQIFATDLDNESIKTAKKGFYSANCAVDITANRLERHFHKTEKGYRIKKELSDVVVFSEHNLIMQPAFTKLDILCCRNLLIYLDATLQHKIIGLFHSSLRENGLLILGTAEIIGSHRQLFETKDSALKIYKRANVIQKTVALDFPFTFLDTKRTEIAFPYTQNSVANIERLTHQFLLQHASPPGILVNENGDILFMSGKTDKFLEPAVGKANLNIFALLRNGFRKDFPLAFHNVIQFKETVVLHQFKENMTIQWIDEPEALKGSIMIFFNA